MVITIDGPAGAGKSTVARGLAERLGFEFLDTGAMYRAVAWACLSQNIELTDGDAVGAAAASVTLEMTANTVICNGTDVTTLIRTAEVSEASSRVAAVPAVRSELVRLQREVAAGRNIVTEGRDQGSVVFPDAECKFFLTADPRRRAERRLKDLEQNGETATLDDVLQQIVDRDQRDQQRAVAPLIKAADAIEVDTSTLSAAEVLDHLANISGHLT
ncbi:MAG: (d)CMP kinase [Planctomycetota bacterium]|jgi:cytidylate kinase